MKRRSVAAAVGTGITVFLVVAVTIIELLNVEFSAIVGLPAGLVAGAAVAVLVSARYETLNAPAGYAVDAAAGFGLAILALLVVSYIDLAGLRSELSADVTVMVGVLVAALTALASWRTAQ